MRKPFYGWWIVAVSMLGLGTGVISLLLWTFGVFLKPLTAEFGWSRTAVSAAVLCSTVATVLVSPFIGRLADRYGARRVALPSYVLLALVFSSFSLMTGPIWQLYLLFALTAVLGSGTSSIVYGRVVANWFDRRRGIALGLTLAGVGIGAFLAPLYTQWLIEHFGWRRAYVGLVLPLLVLTLPLTWRVLRDEPRDLGLVPDGRAGAVPATETETTTPAARAQSTAAALRSRTFWLMAVAFACAGFAVTGPMLHLAAMLSDRGMSPGLAAAAQSAVGLALVFGRVLAGHLMDRWFAPQVAIAFLLASGCGLVALAAGASGTGAFVAAVLLGLAAGAEIDVIAFLTSRYFGTAAFGELYGWQYATYSAAAGAAPIVTAMGFDSSGSYTGILWVLAAVLGVGVLLLSRLGPYASAHQQPGLA